MYLHHFIPIIPAVKQLSYDYFRKDLTNNFQLFMNLNSVPLLNSACGKTALIFISLAWFGSNIFLNMMRRSGSDAFQYSSPFAYAGNFGDNKLPMLGDFSPFSEARGLQWPGLMLLKSAVYTLFSYSSSHDFYLCLFLNWTLACALYSYVVFLTKRLSLGISVFIIVLSDPNLLWFTANLFFSIPVAQFSVSDLRPPTPNL